MATEIAEKEEAIKKLDRENRRLSDLNGQISSRVFSANKPLPAENAEQRPRADRRARRAVSEDRHSGRHSHSSSRNRLKFSTILNKNRKKACINNILSLIQNLCRGGNYTGGWI